MRHYQYEDLSIGMEEQFSVELHEGMMKEFCGITGDINPLHCDREFALGHHYSDRVVYGMLTASFLSTLGGYISPVREV